MAKTANLYARIEPSVKEQAENILSTLGITSSNAITLFYKQIILQRGLPFDVKIPNTHMVDANVLTVEELDAELDKGFIDIKEGRTKPAKAAFAEIRRDYGL